MSRMLPRRQIAIITIAPTGLAREEWGGPVFPPPAGAAIGFLNPTIYGDRQGGPGYDSAFHDITSGSNNNGLGTTYSAVVGYDLVTGWGSPKGQVLLDELGPVYTGPNFSLTPSPGTIDVTQGNTGTSTITLSSLNGFAATVNLAVTVLGQPVGVTPSLNP